MEWRFLDFTQPGLWRFYRGTVTENVALAAWRAATGVCCRGRAKLSLVRGHGGRGSSRSGTDATGDSGRESLETMGSMGMVGNRIKFIQTRLAE